MLFSLPHRSNFSQRLGISGQVLVTGFNADYVKTFDDYLSERKRRQGRIYQDVGHNLIVDAGSNQIGNLCVGANTNSFTHNGVGSSTTAVAAGQTDLQTPITRIAVTSRYQVSNASHFDTFWDSATGNGTWNETGIFTAISSGTMGSRKVLSSPFTKSTANTATVAWTWTISPI